MKISLTVTVAVSLFCGFLLVGCGQQQIDSYRDTSDFDDTERAMFQQLKQSSSKSDAEIFQIMGINYFKEQKKDRAIKCLKRATQLDPNLFDCWHTLGLLHLYSKEGNEFLQKAIEANPDHAPSYYYLAYVYLRQGKYKKSIDLFTKYITVAKDKPSEANRYKNAQAILEKMQACK